MTIRKHNPWESSCDISALVPLPSRGCSLFAHASGPVRRPGGPVVIFFTGAGAASAVYVKVQQHLSNFVRTLFYDRAGYNESTLPVEGTTLLAQDGAKDLNALLKAIDVPPPYILLGHSFGSIPLREFLHFQLAEHQSAKPTDVVPGIVLCDTAVELEFELFKRIPSIELVTIGKGVDWEESTNFREECGMTDEEYQAAIESSQRTAEKGTAKREDTRGSARALAERMQLETHAYSGGNLAVRRFNSAADYQKLCDEGVRLGVGSEQERRLARKFIHDWKIYNYTMVKAQIDLVGEHGRTQYRELMDWGHDGLLREPTLAGDAVRWILDELGTKQDEYTLQN